MAKIDIKLSKKWTFFSQQEIEIRGEQGNLYNKKLNIRPEVVFNNLNVLIENLMQEYFDIYQLETAIDEVELVRIMFDIAIDNIDEKTEIYLEARHKADMLRKKRLTSKKDEWAKDKQPKM